MCFSATASFAASGVLVATGVAVGVKAKKQERYLMVIPLVFAFQQFAEGVQWLALANGAASILWAYMFLFFALFFWPIYVPYAAMRLEPLQKRKRFIQPFIVVGVIVDLLLLIAVLRGPIEILNIEHHIVYEFGATSMLWAMLYVGGISASLLINSRPFVKLYGVAAFVSAIISYVVFEVAFASVWCFFAAVLSVMVLLAVGKKR